ncbi:MAG: hypothetical protein HZA92_06935 [Verrucomicrobia bacterium]|mgnify:CR=1 FL=1|nr:hypothetical protein [Verrucomicrobiota bacterium]
MKQPSEQFQREFLAPAMRAFRRVAKKLREENARLGLPLVVGVGNRVVYVPVKLARKPSRKKSLSAVVSKVSKS